MKFFSRHHAEFLARLDRPNPSEGQMFEGLTQKNPSRSYRLPVITTLQWFQGTDYYLIVGARLETQDIKFDMYVVWLLRLLTWELHENDAEFRATRGNLHL